MRLNLILEAIFLQPLRQPRTERIDVFRPQIRDAIEHDEPDREEEVPPSAATSDEGAGDHLAILLDVGRQRDAEHHPHEERADERAVQQVHGEGVLAEPEEVFVGEDVFDGGGEVDP